MMGSLCLKICVGLICVGYCFCTRKTFLLFVLLSNNETVAHCFMHYLSVQKLLTFSHKNNNIFEISALNILRNRLLTILLTLNNSSGVLELLCYFDVLVFILST